MNKQELINRLKEILTTPSEIEGYDFDDGYDFGIERAISLAKDLDDPVISPEQEKPVIPKFVADWYEDHKDNFEIYLSGLCINFTCHRERLNDKLANWYEQLENKPIQTLVNMHQFGYEIEKEKQYVVVIPEVGRNGFMQLWKNKEGKLLFNFEDKIRYGEVYLLTEQEIKHRDERLLQFAEEVNNNDD